MRIFFQWLWLALLIFTALGYAFCLGFFHKIYQYDISHLTLVIYLIFLYTTFKIGKFSLEIENIKDKSKETNNFIEKINILATRCQYIGIIGTSLGIGIGISGVAEQAEAFAKVGTSILNVVVSMTAFILLDIQCQHVVTHINKKYKC